MPPSCTDDRGHPFGQRESTGPSRHVSMSFQCSSSAISLGWSGPQRARPPLPLSAPRGIIFLHRCAKVLGNTPNPCQRGQSHSGLSLQIGRCSGQATGLRLSAQPFIHQAAGPPTGEIGQGSFPTRPALTAVFLRDTLNLPAEWATPPPHNDLFISLLVRRRGERVKALFPPTRPNGVFLGGTPQTPGKWSCAPSALPRKSTDAVRSPAIYQYTCH